MRITQERLQSIIFEEYLKEEGIVGEALSPEKADEFIAWIKGKSPKPEWLDREYGPGSYRRKKGLQAPVDPNVDRAAETMPFPANDIPADDAPESEYSGFQSRSTPEDVPETDALVDQISALVQDMPAEEVSDLFQAVFSQIPGVEIGPPEDEDPETLYSPGAEGRPQVGFQLEELKSLIREILAEGHYHDMGGEDEVYDVLDPHGFDKMPDADLIDMMYKDGMEEMIVLDGDGDLANREEVIATLKDV